MSSCSLKLPQIARTRVSGLRVECLCCRVALGVSSLHIEVQTSGKD